MEKIFSEEELKVIRCVISATWEYVGGDYLELLPNHIATREHVLEATLDADRWRRFAKNESEKRIVERLLALEWKEIKKLSKKILLFNRYGY